MAPKKGIVTVEVVQSQLHAQRSYSGGEGGSINHDNELVAAGFWTFSRGCVTEKQGSISVDVHLKVVSGVPCWEGASALGSGLCETLNYPHHLKHLQRLPASF